MVTQVEARIDAEIRDLSPRRLPPGGGIGVIEVHLMFGAVRRVVAAVLIIIETCDDAPASDHGRLPRDPPSHASLSETQSKTHGKAPGRVPCQRRGVVLNDIGQETCEGLSLPAVQRPAAKLGQIEPNPGAATIGEGPYPMTTLGRPVVAEPCNLSKHFVGYREMWISRERLSCGLFGSLRTPRPKRAIGAAH